MGRVINIDELWKELEILYDAKNGEVSWNDALWKIKSAPVFESNAQQWIPFKTRPLTEEEKEEHPKWDFILDCPLPDDGQRILVNIKYKGHEAVQLDEYYDDDGSYLDSGYEIGTEANAWMPLPEPWKGEEQ